MRRREKAWDDLVKMAALSIAIGMNTPAMRVRMILREIERTPWLVRKIRPQHTAQVARDRVAEALRAGADYWNQRLDG